MIKRLFDLIFSASAIILLSPLFLLLIVLVAARIGLPVFFIQIRPGKEGKLFKMYKFRTMTNEKDRHGNLFPDKDRLTDIGKFLRKTSLDEFPELINVFKGDMSFVGPRPLLVKYLPLYNDFQKKRHEIKPGITGWAQINGRNAISWEEKFKLDVWYIENKNFWLDLKILFLTLYKSLKREGISAEGEATMSEFKGT